MINHGLKMLKRAIDERPKGGMQTGMPKIQLREADAVRAVAELEWAQQRITELEDRIKDFEDIVAESTGVVGWHLNGAVATWEELGLFTPKEQGHD